MSAEITIHIISINDWTLDSGEAHASKNITKGENSQWKGNAFTFLKFGKGLTDKQRKLKELWSPVLATKLNLEVGQSMCVKYE